MSVVIGTKLYIKLYITKYMCANFRGFCHKYILRYAGFIDIKDGHF